MFQSLAVETETSLTEVMPGPGGGNFIYLLRQFDEYLAVASFSTRYIADLGRQITFGVKGHAAIVDHRGNVLAHPLENWIEERRNIAKVSAVKRMLAGETGVETFFSPALKGDMIAGFTAVPSAGWGVMVPQPVVELHDKADEAENSALIVMGFGFFIAALLAMGAAFWMSRPLEKIADSAERVGRGQLAEFRVRGWLPQELARLQSSFGEMVDKLRVSTIKVNQLAYVDQVTGTGNRAYFMRRAGHFLRKYENTNSAIFFIDLDGFKPVNDRFGHDVGDIVLQGVADRIAEKFEVTTLIDHCEGDPLSVPMTSDEVIFGRLGGDEFALLLAGIDQTTSAMAAGECIIELLREPFRIHDQSVSLGASIGVARAPKDGRELSQLIKKADVAMYSAKRAGRNRTVVFDTSLQMKEGEAPVELI